MFEDERPKRRHLRRKGHPILEMPRPPHGWCWLGRPPAPRAARHSTFDGAAFLDAPGGDRRGCPELNSLPATGTDYSVALVVVARTNSERLGSENSFDTLCGVTPAEACSGKVVRHRFNLL